MVGVGASAGGLEALEATFRAMPSDLGVAFVIVQHLSPDHKSHMADLLSRHTRMPVVQATDGLTVAPNALYVLPPKKVMTIEGGSLRLQDRVGGLNLPIDVFFESLAQDLGERAIGVVLSGTGSDGMHGIRAIKEAGGLVVIQDLETARFDGMPRAALSLGLADHVLPPAEIGATLAAYVTHLSDGQSQRHHYAENAGAQARLMVLLRRHTGVDFAKYKSTTVSRRVRRRLAVNQIDTIEEYLAFCENDPAEVNALFKELLIGVTQFFREPEVFEHVRDTVIPRLLEQTRPTEPLRVWVAGCATGEEAYTLAMLFEECFDTVGPRDVKIFATDIDRAALEFAGAGIYPESVAHEMSPERVRRFFVPRGDGLQIARFLRQRVVFANHDVARDAPFGRVDLVSCRNLLIYFTPPLQQTVLSSFRYALRPGGFLLLGSSETLGDSTEGFDVEGPTSLKLFRRANTLAYYPNLGEHPRPDKQGESRAGRSQAVGGPPSALRTAYDAIIEAFAPPTVLVSDRNELVHVFGAPSPLLRFAPGAMTTQVLDLLPAQIAAVAGTALHRVFRDGGPARYTRIPTDFGHVTLSASPVRSTAGIVTHALLSFAIEAAEAKAPDSSNHVSSDARRQIADLQQELQFSRENLQATIEELETSNEELQATNEELVASNEELQSANEELQSVNEELHTLNAEYQAKINELVRLNDDIDNLLRSAHIGVVFLDETLTVTRFTPAAADIFNLLERDVGRPIAHISARFDAAWLHASLAEVCKTGAAIERELSTDGPHTLRIRVEPYVSKWSNTGGVVITAIDVTMLKEAERALARVIDALPQRIAVIDSTGTITLVNEAWRAFTRGNGGHDDHTTGVGANYLDVCRRSRDAAPEAATVYGQLVDLLTGKRSQIELEYPCHSPTEKMWYMMQALPIHGARGGAVVSHVNITSRKLLELELRHGLREVDA